MSATGPETDGLASRSRRAFLRGGQSDPLPLRPPWAAADFARSCTGCGDCVDACPEGVIRIGPGGLAQVAFESGGCTLCGACADACEPKAIDRGAAPLPFPHRMRITSRCLTDRGIVCESCRDACPERAISLRLPGRGVPRPGIEADLCTGCGLCVQPCPVAAIEIVPGSAGRGAGDAG